MRLSVFIALIVMGCHKDEVARDSKDKVGGKIIGEASQPKIQPESSIKNPPIPKASGLSDKSGDTHLSPKASGLEETLDDRFRAEVQACRLAVGERRSCDLTGPIELEGRVSVACLNRLPHTNDYVTNSIIVRVFDGKPLTMCTEQIAVRMLDGLNGFTAKVFDITGGVPEGCEKRVMAMELKGDGIWRDSVVAFDRAFHLRFARLLEAVRSLHEKGFVHSDITGADVIIQTNDPNFIALDGFRFAFVYSAEEPDEFFNRRTDMKAIPGLLQLIPSRPKPTWIYEFDAEMRVLADNERPDYEKWIDFCRGEATKLVSYT